MTSSTAPTDDRDPVDLLAEDFADRLRRGEHPSIGDYAAAHPAHADQLRDVLPAVAQMEFLKRFRKAATVADSATMPDQFGDFRIVRELGRGGMGVVFEAVQESLNRSVALKVLAARGQLDGTRRERFVREAHAAAKLHHTNIVPVFGVGEQDGLPYYAMQLIRGEGLNTLAHRWRCEQGRVPESAGSTVANRVADTGSLKGSKLPEPTEFDTPGYADWSFVAEVGLQVADALHYAHKQGVLHRDVKPANLLLDPSGRVWVTDFGLAKLVEQQGITASGDILGTLQYLPPESLTGDADARSDVYGLGATLYELLTLEPPYPSDNPARLLKLVADTEPKPLRSHNPAIPRDLETIVMKAMAREPDHRYASARELAGDLQAFLEDRPIKARRQSLIGRGWRWCRKNPTVAMLTVNMVAALVLAGIVGWVGYVQTKQALNAEEVQLAAANVARADAEQASAKLESNLRLCLEAFESVFDAAGGKPGFAFAGRGFGPGGPGGPGGGPGGFGGPGGSPDRQGGPGGGVPGGPKGGGPGDFGGGPSGPDGVDRPAAVLEAILAFYDKFAEQNTTNPRLQLEAGRAHRRVGELHSWRGNTEKSAASFRRAAGLLEDLIRKYPRDVNGRAELVQTYLSAPADAFADYERILLRSVELARSMDDGPRPNLAGSVLFKLGWVRQKNGDAAGAEKVYREAITALAAPRASSDDRPPATVAEQATARLFLASLLTDARRFADARNLLEESLTELRGPSDRSRPVGRQPWEIISATYQQLAEVCDKSGDRDAAKRAREEASRLSGNGGHDRPKGPNPPPKKKD